MTEVGSLEAKLLQEVLAEFSKQAEVWQKFSNDQRSNRGLVVINSMEVVDDSQWSGGGLMMNGGWAGGPTVFGGPIVI